MITKIWRVNWEGSNHLQMNWYMKYLDHLQYQLLIIPGSFADTTPWPTHAGLNLIPSTENPWIRRYLGSVRCRPRQRSLGFVGTAIGAFVGFRNLVREFLEAGYLFCFIKRDLQIDSISYIFTLQYSDSHWFQPNVLLMEEILLHLGCSKPFKEWDKLPINWCRISSINSISCGCQICHKFRWAHWFQ